MLPAISRATLSRWLPQVVNLSLRLQDDVVSQKAGGMTDHHYVVGEFDSSRVAGACEASFHAGLHQAPVISAELCWERSGAIFT